MENKEKNEIDEEKKLNNNSTPKNKVPDDNLTEEEQEKNIINISPEDLNQILNQLKEKFDIGDENIRIVKIEKKKRPTKELILSILFSYFIDLVLVFSLNGYLQFASPNIFSLAIFSIIFSTVEYIFRVILMKYLFRIMFSSLGLVLLPMTIISFIIAYLATPGIEIDNNKLILFFILFIAIRVLIKMLIMRKNNNIMRRGK